MGAMLLNGPFGATMIRKSGQALFFLAALLVPVLDFSGNEIFCDGPKAAQDGNRWVSERNHFDNWQRLHALGLGRCQKVLDGGIHRNRAIDLFEEECGRAIRREKPRMVTTGSPLGIQTHFPLYHDL